MAELSLFLCATQLPAASTLKWSRASDTARTDADTPIIDLKPSTDVRELPYLMTISLLYPWDITTRFSQRLASVRQCEAIRRLPRIRPRSLRYRRDSHIYIVFQKPTLWTPPVLHDLLTRDMMQVIKFLRLNPVISHAPGTFWAESLV